MERTVVDTSVWIANFRAVDPLLAAHLSELATVGLIVVPKPVQIEILIGVRQSRLAIMRDLFEGVELVIPNADTWKIVEGWMYAPERQGQSYGLSDLLIAAVAHQFNLPVWSLDRDFERLGKAGFCRLYRPSNGSPH